MKLSPAIFLLIVATVILRLGQIDAQATSKRTLVLLDDKSLRSSHSKFFNSLEGRGFKLDYHLASDSNVALQKYGEYQYDNVILIAPKTEELGSKVRVADLLSFIDSGRNIVIAVGAGEVSEPIRELVGEVGFDLDDDNSLVIDHVRHIESAEDVLHTTIAGDNVVQAPSIVGAAHLNPVAFRGIGMAQQADNGLTIPVLTASQTAFSYKPQEKVTPQAAPHAASTSTVLVGALQARNNARVVVFASIDMLSNKFFDAPITVGGKQYAKSGNEAFAAEVSKWALHERGILRHRDITHHKKGETEVPSVYRISEDIEYSVIIEEFVGDKWVPYDASDLQLEFIMLDPYVRMPLTHSGEGKYTASFMTPDVYGVFKFDVHYKRLGYSFLSFSTQIPVRPFKINEYERFIDSAYPYYLSAFSVMAAFFIFGALFLYTREEKVADKPKQQ